MSLSDQLINVIELDGTTKQIKLYTEISDVTEVYKDFLYNGQTLYASTTTDPNDEYATGLKYLDENGVVRYLCTEGSEPLSATNGTVVINGNLSTDIVINGNLKVTGTISGNAKASGTITYGSLTGTISQKATISSCDISADGGTLTFDGNVSKNNNVLYSRGTITNASGTTTSFYSAFDVEADVGLANYGTVIIETSSTIEIIASGSSIYNQGSITISGVAKATATDSLGFGIYSDNVFTIANGGIVEATGNVAVYTYSGRCTVDGALTATGSGIGVWVYSGCTFTVSGTLYTVAPSSDYCIEGTVKTAGSGKIYKNGVLQ